MEGSESGCDREGTAGPSPPLRSGRDDKVEVVGGPWGWLLGWSANGLTPLPANQLTDTQVSSPGTYFLSAIWMSGYGVAADASGDLFFVTGNTDYSGTTYNDNKYWLFEPHMVAIGAGGVGRVAT